MKTRSYFGNALIPALRGLILGQLPMTRQSALFQPVLAGFHLATGGRAQ